MKTYVFSLLILLAPGLAFTPQRPEFPANREEIVQINGGCTGFVASDSIVFTASHCVDEGAPAQVVRFYDGLFAKFEVVAQGEAVDYRDWAILRGDTRGIEPLEFLDEVPDEETPCAIIGHGGGRPAQYATVCEVRPPLRRPWNRYVALHAVAIPGDSGSPVFDMNGKVFAILVRSSFPVPVGLGVDVQLARRAYREWLEKQADK